MDLTGDLMKDFGWEFTELPCVNSREEEVREIDGSTHLKECEFGFGKIADVMVPVNMFREFLTDTIENEAVPEDISDELLIYRKDKDLVAIQLDDVVMYATVHMGDVVMIKTKSDEDKYDVLVSDTTLRGVCANPRMYIRGTLLSTGKDVVFLRNNVDRLYPRNPMSEDVTYVKVTVKGI